MKYLIMFCFVLMVAGMVSCKKGDNNTSLVGNWHIISDSTSIAGAGPFKGGGATYAGTSGDYYNFKADGHLYVKEGSNSDTASYSLLNGGNQLNLQYTSIHQAGVTIYGAQKTFDLTMPAGNKLILTSKGLTPEGLEVQILNLSK